MAVIDFHSHILPSMDDGSKSVEMSMEMLKLAAAQGVDVMLATSHFYASRQRIEDFLTKRKNAFEELMQRKKEFGPELRLGAEVAFFPGISRADKLEALTVEGSRVLLLEMPFAAWSRTDIREVEFLMEERHFQIILAHLERYISISENKKWIKEFLEMPVYIQINAESLLSWKKRGKILKMFARGQADFLGSDCHRSNRRKPNLAQGREVLHKKLGDVFLEEMDRKGSQLLQIGG